ncbi:MAG: DNA replication and repair protein RecF, partial [Bacteroidetes bacterium]|nr:DNA replication and repair protein RecF [Bacteroidota bacterium]
MYLQRLQLSNFKNYETCELEFSTAINCFVGNNGVGKTNILDAVHYLSLAKSFFSQSELQSIRHGDDFFIVSGIFSHDAGDDTISCSFVRQKQKTLKCNGKEYERITDHIGRFP